jgi:VWFA-related protein
MLLVLPMQGQSQLPAAPAASVASQPDSTTQVTTLHTYSNLVVVDVVVSDSKGNPIHGLKASDFTLLENNKPQSIRSFEEHTSAEATKTVRVPKLPAGLFTNKAPAPAAGPVNVLLLDYLNTPLAVQPYARKQILDYLDKMAPGTRIAIFGLTTQLYMLQGFTSDPEQLKAALNSKKGAPQASQIMTDVVNGDSASNSTTTPGITETSLLAGFVTADMIANAQRFAAFNTSFQLDLRAKYTLGGFEELARYLVGIPGRKNVIWFSASFPLNVEPDPNIADPQDTVVRNDDELRRADNLLTRAQVAVYPVDARGLQTDQSQSATSGTAMGGADAATATMAFMTSQAQEHETMYAMAEETGGEAFVNTNGLTQAIAQAVNKGSNYYTLTYTPTNQQWDQRFRAIKIKLEDLPKAQLSYRNGYYADDPNDRNKLVAGVAATALAQPTTMVSAMVHGGPEPAEILFKVRIRPASTTNDPTPLATNQTNPDPKVKVQGPYRSYGVDLVPDPKAVSCTVDDSGNHHCAVEIWTFVYNNEGDKLITVSDRVRTMLTPDDYATLLTTGMAFHQEISVPVKGQYYIRTAIHDLNSDRVGAREVPVATVASLQPLEAQTVTPEPAPVPPAASAPAATAPATDVAPVAEPATRAATPK